MSLINEALKKAQRLRNQQQAGTAPGFADGSVGPIEKRSQPMPAQTLIIIIASATVLVVLSVIGTVFLLNRAPNPKPAPLVAAKPPSSAVDLTAPSPVIVAPVIKPAPPVEEAPPVVTTAASAPAQSTNAPDTLPPAAKPAGSAPQSSPREQPKEVEAVASLPPPVAPKPAPQVARDPTAPDPHIQSFVDAVRVAGIRSSGNDSKVLMNDRVYRVNDFVDRSLGVKLVKVESDTLTFSDAAGFIYTKSF